MKILAVTILLFTFSVSLFAQTDKSKEATQNGFNLFQQGKYEKAVLFFDEAIKLNSQAFDAIYYRGIAKLILRKPTEAIFDFNAVIDKFPNMRGIDEVYQLRGLCYYFLKINEKALPDFEKSILINPTRAESYHGRANVLSDKGENEKALADYSKALQLKPNLTAVYVDRAILYFTIGKFEDALKDYDKSIEMTPNVAPSYVERGIIKGLLTTPLDSIEDIYKGFSLEKNVVLEKRNESSTSPFKRLSKYIDENLSNYKALQIRAILRLFQNNQEEAEKDFKAAEKINSKLQSENEQISSKIKKMIKEMPTTQTEIPKIYSTPKP